MCRKFICLSSFVFVLGLFGNVSGQIATNPTPADRALHTSTLVGLSWSRGDTAVSHNVYFGENYADVEAGTGETFIGNQAATTLIIGMPGFPYPGGLIPGTTYYWRVDEVEADGTTIYKGDVWSFSIAPRTAYNPFPSDGRKYVDLDVLLQWTAGMGAKFHHLYFGENFADVEAGTGGTYKGPVAGTSYSPGVLAKDSIYYWRVDEFDGSATHKGDVWRFRTLGDITITDPDLSGWWKLDRGFGTTALDWSGHGNHGTLFGGMQWIAGYDGEAVHSDGLDDYIAIQNMHYASASGIREITVCAWIRTTNGGDQAIASFDRNEYWRLQINGEGGGDGQIGWSVWTSADQVDYGSVTRVDDGLWHHVTGVFDNGRLTIYIDGRPESSATGGSTFGRGRNIRYGFIGSQSEATEFNGAAGTRNCFDGDIDDVRIYDKVLTQEEIKLAMRGDVTLAWDPNPTNGSTLNIKDAVPLTWSPGDKASQHDVYFGTDRDDVENADTFDMTGIYRGRQAFTSYSPPEGVEWGGGPYYWRIDEYNNDATISTGRMWIFTVADFIAIDDFEDYNNIESGRIFDTWKDGWGIPTNGSEVGYADPNFNAGEHHVETAIVHSGQQSMPYFYDNSLKYSEATMKLIYPRNWTEQGVGVLSLWFYGDPNNAPERMYVAIANNLGTTGVVYNGDPNIAMLNAWTQWNIDLNDFATQGVNLTDVDNFSIGFGDKNNLQPGGSGKIYFDDIRLYRPSAEEPKPNLNGS